VALMHSAETGDAEHAMLDKLAGRGFLDMTRLAASDYRIWEGILKTNGEAIRAEARRFAETLGLLSGGPGGDTVAALWESAARRRRTMGPESVPRPRKPDLRGMIDRYDKQIVAALGHRIQAVRKIGKLKMRQAAPIVDPDREKRMMLQRAEWGRSLGLPGELLDELFAVILRHSSRIQNEDR